MKNKTNVALCVSTIQLAISIGVLIWVCLYK